jgi:hypothetical protein
LSHLPDARLSPPPLPASTRWSTRRPAGCAARRRRCASRAASAWRRCLGGPSAMRRGRSARASARAWRRRCTRCARPPSPRAPARQQGMAAGLPGCGLRPVACGASARLTVRRCRRPRRTPTTRPPPPPQVGRPARVSGAEAVKLEEQWQDFGGWRRGQGEASHVRPWRRALAARESLRGPPQPLTLHAHPQPPVQRASPSAGCGAAGAATSLRSGPPSGASTRATAAPTCCRTRRCARWCSTGSPRRSARGGCGEGWRGGWGREAGRRWGERAGVGSEAAAGAGAAGARRRDGPGRERDPARGRHAPTLRQPHPDGGYHHRHHHPSPNAATGSTRTCPSRRTSTRSRGRRSAAPTRRAPRRRRPAPAPRKRERRAPCSPLCNRRRGGPCGGGGAGRGGGGAAVKHPRPPRGEPPTGQARAIKVRSFQSPPATTTRAPRAQISSAPASQAAQPPPIARRLNWPAAPHTLPMRSLSCGAPRTARACVGARTTQRRAAHGARPAAHGGGASGSRAQSSHRRQLLGALLGGSVLSAGGLWRGAGTAAAAQSSSEIEKVGRCPCGGRGVGTGRPLGHLCLAACAPRLQQVWPRAPPPAPSYTPRPTA